MTPFLFVYGTLMPDADGPTGTVERIRLMEQGELLGKASARGRLFDLGAYPGFTQADGPEHFPAEVVPGSAKKMRQNRDIELRSDPVGSQRVLVHGAVYRLHQPAGTLSWLDEYEGVGFSSADEYRREPLPVTLANGTSLTAWTYVFIGGLGGLCQIPSGRWRHRPA